MREFAGCCLVVTHDPIDALLFADRIIVLEDGRVVQDDLPSTIAANPHTEYVAALMSLNLICGLAQSGVLVRDDGCVLQIGDQGLMGPAAAVVRPESVSVHRQQPEGSARNTWRGVVSLVQPWESKVRVHVEGRPSVIACITTQAARELALSPGVPVWLSVKAVDIRAYPLHEPERISVDQRS